MIVSGGYLRAPFIIILLSKKSQKKMNSFRIQSQTLIELEKGLAFLRSELQFSQDFIKVNRSIL